MIESVIALLREVSHTEIMPRFRHLAAADIRQKTGPQDMVTVADEAAERALGAGLRALFPGDDIIGEEAVAANPALLERLKQPGRVWVLDPIDGTANFTSDLPLFGVMAALIEADQVLAGFIHDPVGDDTAVAIAGGGAWMIDAAGSRRRLHVAPPVPVGAMVGSFSWRFLAAPLRRQRGSLAAVPGPAIGRLFHNGVPPSHRFGPVAFAPSLCNGA